MDASMSTFIMVHNFLAMLTIGLLGSERQKVEFLPSMAALQRIGSWALTEPSNGSDAAALTASAEWLVSGGVNGRGVWRLNGQKRWIGNATFAEVIIVWARDTSSGQVRRPATRTCELLADSTHWGRIAIMHSLPALPPINFLRPNKAQPKRSTPLHGPGGRRVQPFQPAAGHRIQLLRICGAVMAELYSRVGHVCRQLPARRNLPDRKRQRARPVCSPSSRVLSAACVRAGAARLGADGSGGGLAVQVSVGRQ